MGYGYVGYLVLGNRVLGPGYTRYWDQDIPGTGTRLSPVLGPGLALYRTRLNPVPD